MPATGSTTTVYNKKVWWTEDVILFVLGLVLLTTAGLRYMRD